MLVQALHLNLHHVHQLRKSGMTSHTDLITTHIRRSLSRLARGADEFTPCFNGGGKPDDPAYYAAPRAWYHLAQIATYVPLDELDAVARKSGDGEAETAREYWTKMLNAHTEQARTLALHAGQLLCVLRDFPTHSASPSRALDDLRRDARTLTLPSAARRHTRARLALLRRPRPLPVRPLDQAQHRQLALLVRLVDPAAIRRLPLLLDLDLEGARRRSAARRRPRRRRVGMGRVRRRGRHRRPDDAGLGRARGRGGGEEGAAGRRQGARCAPGVESRENVRRGAAEDAGEGGELGPFV